MSLTKEALQTYLDDELGLDEDEIDDTTPLFSSGLIDSFSLIQLITFIEGEASIRVAPTEVSLDNLDTIENILNFVAKRTS